MLRRLTLGATAFYAPGLFAAALRETAEVTEGPFYPDKLPLDTDNDLLIVNDAITPAVGEITYLTGRILTNAGQPMRNAFVEIWQCDARGNYIHTKGRTPTIDSNFQGYGRFLTDSTGQYHFRTIKPVPYTTGGVSRCPHIHLAVSRNGKRILTTQVSIRGHEMNRKDTVLQRIKDEAVLNTVLTDFKPLPSSKLGESAAKFDVILGRTAAEDESGVLGGVGKRVIATR